MRHPIPKLAAAILIVASGATAQLENARVGIIDFFALGDLRAEALRAALTVHPDDRLIWPETRNTIMADAAKAAGRPATNFSLACCDSKARWNIFVGFGDKSPATTLSPRPSADVRLSPELADLYREFTAALPASLKFSAGRPDDYSAGYSLSPHPPMQAIQRRMRTEAVDHEQELLSVLRTASDARQRIAASHLVGYTRQSPDQIAALVDASQDPDETVRNNAIRALAVLAATPAIARRIPARPFINKLNSAAWPDRNKGLMLLVALTRDRDPELLALLRADALPALIEMAQWRHAPHAANPIRLLGRIAGIEESQLDALAESGNASLVLKAVAVR